MIHDLINQPTHGHTGTTCGVMPACGRYPVVTVGRWLKESP